MSGGYFDHGKKILEINTVGAVAHQINIQFEFDRDQISQGSEPSPSELDDLDNEVSGIAGKNQSSSRSPLKHEEIKI